MKYLAGPWCGEWGWELMTWVPHLRWLASKGHKVHVICQPWHEFFYSDFMSGYDNWTFNEGIGDLWNFNARPTTKPFVPTKFKNKYPDHEIYLPNKERCLNGKQMPIQYGVVYLGAIYDLIIHARKENKYGSKTRNWSMSNWTTLATLLKDKGLSIVSMGSKHGAYHVPGTDDLRDEYLPDLCDTMAASRLLIGPSSGPMHLGELTGTPRIVWTGPEKQKIFGGATNKERYERIWKQFDTPVKVIEEWQPSVEKVYKAVAKRICV